MPGRQYNSTTYYRYGFNGKEKDNKDGVVQYDYGFRIYDPRLVRFKSVDPLQTSYPELTPYQFASNTPIQGVDLDGREVYHYLLVWHKGQKEPVLKYWGEQTREFAWWEGVDKTTPSNSFSTANGDKITDKTIRVWTMHEVGDSKMDWREGDDIGRYASHRDFDYFKELQDWQAAGFPATPVDPAEIEAQKQAGEQMAQQATLQLMMMTLSQQIDAGDGDFDGYAAPGSQPRPNTSVATIKQTTSTNSGTTPVGGKITGYTKHGLNQAIGRNGGKGVSAAAILGAVKNPIKVTPEKNGAVSYKGKDAKVLLNKAGKVITTYGKPRGAQQRVQGTRTQGSGSAQRKANKKGFSYYPKAIK